MTLERAVDGLGKTGDPVDAERANIIAEILRSRGKDIPLWDVKALQNTLPQRERLTDPDVVTSTFQAIWQERQEILRQKGVDLEFSIPECPYIKEELLELEREGKRVGYLPVELSTQKSRHIMAKIWPQMQSESVKVGNQVTNETDISGWFDYEAAIDAPYIGTSEDQLDEFKRQGRKGLNLNQYIVAGQDSKLFTGKYLDEDNTWVRLFYSYCGGNIIIARFNSDGYLYVDWNLSPQDRPSRLGGRSSGLSNFKTILRGSFSVIVLK